jgi:hypothetical protein
MAGEGVLFLQDALVPALLEFRRLPLQPSLTQRQNKGASALVPAAAGSSLLRPLLILFIAASGATAKETDMPQTPALFRSAEQLMFWGVVATSAGMSLFSGALFERAKKLFPEDFPLLRRDIKIGILALLAGGLAITLGMHQLDQLAKVTPKGLFGSGGTLFLHWILVMSLHGAAFGAALMTIEKRRMWSASNVGPPPMLGIAALLFSLGATAAASSLKLGLGLSEPVHAVGYVLSIVAIAVGNILLMDSARETSHRVVKRLVGTLLLAMTSFVWSPSLFESRSSAEQRSIKQAA